MVRRNRGIGDDGWPIRGHQRGQILALSVQHRDIIAHVSWHARQYRAGMFSCFAGLQYIAQDQRNAKADTHNPPPAKRQRDRQTSVVHPVHQAEQPIRRSHDLATLPGRMQQQAIKCAGVIVIVPHHDRLLTAPNRLTAS